MAKIHITLQGKGGVGKSFIAVNTAQYKAHKGQKPLCVDTDPVNEIFTGFQSLNVHRLEIMEGDEINSRNFDVLVEMVTPATDDVIIDNGASSFVLLSHYLISNQVPHPATRDGTPAHRPHVDHGRPVARGHHERLRRSPGSFLQKRRLSCGSIRTGGRSNTRARDSSR
ncbi:unnamed protein product [Candidatus Paraburkholderia kirkii UZHbot1]|uniref:WGS project CAFE00000000 data, contig bkir_c107 n=1 Tax=Candidatus Paraburkholderia kirkii UZHbot1 TaxID=1055526 RepID=U3UAE0_9BURK|nr:unnamed protein product [Candidatus Paraburkholderia kirkii UZHbot1]